MTARSVIVTVGFLLTMGLLAGCGSGSAPPTIDEILAEPDTSLTVGESISLRVNVSGAGLKFAWSAQRGSLSGSTEPAVIYTAPDTPGPDTVTVKVTYDGGETIRTIPLAILAPPVPTATVTPVPADTPTTIPEPIACNSPAVTKNLFPQLANVERQIPFYGPETEPNYSCEAVYDLVHNQPLAVHLKYENVGANFGWWGIATPKGYDVTSYEAICFWGYAGQPNQAFRLKMKDTARKEDGIIIILEQPNQWSEICTGLTRFADLGIRLDRLENVNLGFDKDSGSAEVWVADFEFK